MISLNPLSIARHALLGGLLLAAGAASAAAQAPADGSFSNSQRYMPKDGAVLYRTSCQACHMAQGEGAAGAAPR